MNLEGHQLIPWQAKLKLTVYNVHETLRNLTSKLDNMRTLDMERLVQIHCIEV